VTQIGTANQIATTEDDSGNGGYVPVSELTPSCPFSLSSRVRELKKQPPVVLLL